MGLVARKPVFVGGGGGVANNNGAVQSALTRSLISTFVIRFSESIIFRLATSKISSFLEVSVAEGTGLNLDFSETAKTCFVVLRSI